MAQREHAWKAARGTPAEEKRRQALDKARARAAEINTQLHINDTLGKTLLDAKKFEEVSAKLEKGA